MTIAWQSQLLFNPASPRAVSAADSGETEGFNSGSPRTETRSFRLFRYEARSVAATAFTDPSASFTSRHEKASCVYRSGEPPALTNVQSPSAAPLPYSSGPPVFPIHLLSNPPNSTAFSNFVALANVTSTTQFTFGSGR